MNGHFSNQLRTIDERVVQRGRMAAGKWGKELKTYKKNKQGMGLQGEPLELTIITWILKQHCGFLAAITFGIDIVEAQAGKHCTTPGL